MKPRHTHPPFRRRGPEGRDIPREEEQRLIAEAIAAGKLTHGKPAGSSPAVLASTRYVVKYGMNTEAP